jgi:hypothetical protein
MTATRMAGFVSCRSLDAFEMRSRQYAGAISSVWRAVDRQSGITVAIKLYKRAALNDMERHQVGRRGGADALTTRDSARSMHGGRKGVCRDP